MSVVLQSTPVRHAACAFAEGHRASYARGLSQDSLMNRRLHCITSIREQLADYSGSREALSPLLLAVLLLYFLDGFVECRQQQLSVHSHYNGVLAIIEALGGQQAVCSSTYPEASLLLSEFVAADLTEAVLQGRLPYFDAAIWKQIESGQVWWAVQDVGSQSLASVFGTMASISQYSHHKELELEVWRSTICTMSNNLGRHGPVFSLKHLFGHINMPP
ncbi:hypothetical protein PFICI_12740 [Pestalotiopsis fici W106-1]|uniref:Transcription factor domain-containing protein n=1 Tax=Pestalotiopsis fici (strain W106-1 / CGMCC3.15140) TaxID=1229662 RepID=W3WSJ3_PESFW|nr:uncharacterized protein PFICI_12740 [Pestalotiopsis fici W106-1]ETS75796.1 hypothetical protein PFICI_12740 [Pestalotiopsis fici W106-1]